LSRAYASRLKNSKEDRPALIRSQKQWLQSVPAKCSATSAPLSEESLKCVRDKFEERFTMLDSCIDKIDECSRTSGDENPAIRR
jgi:hypothetical protein